MNLRVVIPLLFCLALGPVRGGIVMSLTPSIQDGGHGAELVFSGTLTNSSATDKVFLNDVSFTLTGPSAANLAPDANSFFANVPGILLPGESYSSGEIFRVTLGPGAPAGDYGGTVSVLGGAGISDSASLAGSTFTIHETPLENWRMDHFGDAAGTPAAADTADWDGDGILNLLEYAIGLDPRTADAGGLPAAGKSGGYLTLSFVPNAAATDVSYVVESSTDLVTWGTLDVEDVTGPNPMPPGQRTYRYAHPLAQGGNAFLRLRVVREF